MITVKILSIGLNVALSVLVIELVRREKLTFKYAMGWILASLLAIVLIVFDKLLENISRWFGFQVTSNFIFFTLIGVFAFLGLILTIFLCQQDNRNHTMAQKIGLLELEVKKLKEERGKKP